MRNEYRQPIDATIGQCLLVLGMVGVVVFHQSAGDLLGKIPKLPFKNQSTESTIGKYQQASFTTFSVDTSKTGINDPDFNRAMPHIIKWEGDDKCSNDPHDRGGRTYMGITIGRAREYGYKDPCTMPKTKVYEIYYKSYWLRVPKTLGGPEKLAYFNMIINGTSSRCLKRPDAMSMLNCQQEHYKNSPTAWKHLRGWTNRNNYMKQIVINWK